MKNLKTTIITALLLLATVSCAVAQEKWEYATLTYYFLGPSVRFSGERQYEVIKVKVKKEEGRDNWDTNPVLAKLDELQDKGWEVYSTGTQSATDLQGIIYFLRKKKQ